MTAEETVAWESDQRRWAVPAAAIAGILPLIAAVLISIGFKNAPSNRIGLLLYFNDHAGALFTGSALLAIGALGLGLALFFLYRAVKAREPEQGRKLPRITPYALGLGAVLYALTGTLVSATSPPLGIVAQAITSDRAGIFATHDGQTWQQASDLFKISALNIVTFGQILCSLLLVASVVLISLGAIRTGLLTKFMGYVGVFVGALLLIPIFSTVPIVQSFWLVALAVLFSGRWPSGMPEAWQTGEAKPWPSMQQMREQAATAKMASRRTRGGRPEPQPEPEPAAQVPSQPGAARRKRKKKR
jgi:hypothetical protein